MLCNIVTLDLLITNTNGSIISRKYMKWMLNVSSESATKTANQTNRCKLLRRGFRTLYRPSGPIRHIMLLCDSSILQAAGSAQQHSHQTLNAQFTQMWNISSSLPSPLPLPLPFTHPPCGLLLMMQWFNTKIKHFMCQIKYSVGKSGNPTINGFTTLQQCYTFISFSLNC